MKRINLHVKKLLLLIMLIMVLTANEYGQIWTSIGPFQDASLVGFEGYIYSLASDNNANPNNIYCGKYNGGVFKYTISSNTWDCITKDIDVAKSPVIVRENIIYVGSGIHENGQIPCQYGRGLYKSANYGVTWSSLIPIGTQPPINYDSEIQSLLMHPTNSDVLYCATRKEVYKTTNGWQTQFSLGLSSVIGDNYINSLAFDAEDPKILYVIGTGDFFYKLQYSLDEPVNYIPVKTKIYNSLTQADPNFNPTNIKEVNEITSVLTNTGYKLYVIRTYPTGDFSVTGEVLVSTTHGNSFSLLPTNNINIQHNNKTIIRVTPNGTIYLGDYFAYRIDNTNIPIRLFSNVHDDFRDFLIKNDNEIYIADDGGLHYYNAATSTVSCLNSNISSNDCYSVSISELDPDLIITGAHDNGTIRRKADNSWEHFHGGDGGITLIDWGNPDNYFYNINKALYSSKWGFITGAREFNSPIIQDPVNPLIYYVGSSEPATGGGYYAIKKSIDGAKTFTNIYQSYSPAYAIDVCKLDYNNVIYAGGYRDVYQAYNGLYKSVDGGANWSAMGISGIEDLLKTVSDTSPDYRKIYECSISTIKFDPSNPNTIWIGFKGFEPNKRVFMSTDFGNSWTSYSDGLPNYPVHSLEYDDMDKTLYVGTEVGVYKRHMGESQWSILGTGQSKITAMELKINNTTRKLIVATYGHGLWEINLPINYEESNPLNITSAITWSTDFTVYRDININPGGSLTIDGHITLSPGVKIICMPTYYQPGGILTVNNSGKLEIVDKSKVVVQQGAIFQVQNGYLTVSGSGRVEVESGGYLCLGSNVSPYLTDFNSCIDLYTGAIPCLPTCTGCKTLSQIITDKTGLGNIFSETGANCKSFATDCIIQDMNFNTNTYMVGKNVIIGKNSNYMGSYDVNVTGGTLYINAEQAVTIQSGFNQSAGNLEIEKRK